MTTLLIYQGAILGVEPEDTGLEYRFPDLVVAKALIPGHLLVTADLPDDYAPGRYVWEGGALVAVPAPAPTPSVPAAVTMRQARLALLGAGLLGNVDAAIAALPSPQKEAAKIEWEYSQEVQRHNGFVSVLAPSLGLTPEQTDALFVQAAKL